MKFQYIGYDNTAKKVRGTVEADDLAGARLQLRQQNIRASQLAAVSGPEIGGKSVSELMSADLGDMLAPAKNDANASIVKNPAST